jgi:hypothetical protein
MELVTYEGVLINRPARLISSTLQVDSYTNEDVRMRIHFANLSH